jgi:hypothetical protein
VLLGRRLSDGVVELARVRVGADGWSPAAWSATTLEVPGRVLGVGLGPGDALWMRWAGPTGLHLSRLEGGALAETHALAEVEVSVGAVAVDARGRPWAAWSDAEGHLQVRRREGAATLEVASGLPHAGDARVALCAVGGDEVALARSSSRGVALALLGREQAVPPLTLDDASASQVAVACAQGAVAVTSTSTDGVSAWIRAADGTLSSPVLVDDGAREGQPDHLVGASLSLALDDSGVALAAYQDQTDGALITARVEGGRSARAAHPDAQATRAMHTVALSAAGGLLVLDVAARSAPRLSTSLRLTTGL